LEVCQGGIITVEIQPSVIGKEWILKMVLNVVTQSKAKEFTRKNSSS
jgi:hypothetical protein